MKAKVLKNKAIQESQIDYRSVKKKLPYRYRLAALLLKAIDTDITVFVNTQNTVKKKKIEDIESYLQEKKIEYRIEKAQAQERKILGLSVDRLLSKKESKSNYFLIGFKINKNEFTSELFDVCLGTYDIAYCIGQKNNFNENYIYYKMKPLDVMFNTEYYAEFIYDSIVFETMRSTIDIKPFMEAAEAY